MRERQKRRKKDRERDLPPVQCLFQSIHVFTGRMEHTVSAPDPQLASASGWVDATADKVFSISPPADPSPMIITLQSSCNWLETTNYVRHMNLQNLRCCGMTKVALFTHGYNIQIPSTINFHCKNTFAVDGSYKN